MHIWFAQVSGRMVELLREICASGIIMQPSENDLASPGTSAPISTNTCAARVSMSTTRRGCSRLAHDLAASSYGLRQDDI